MFGGGQKVFLSGIFELLAGCCHWPGRGNSSLCDVTYGPSLDTVLEVTPCEDLAELLSLLSVYLWIMPQR